MNIRKIIEEGSLIPKGYGVAWKSNYGMQITCFPIPLNIIVRAYLDFYYWLIQGCWKSKWERELLNIRLQERRKFMEDYNERLIAHLEKERKA